MNNGSGALKPFSDDCGVTIGSHNFSVSASEKNDENLVIVRGNTKLAQAYALHVNGVYDHYSWRAYLASGGNPDQIYKPLDGWNPGGSRGVRRGISSDSSQKRLARAGQPKRSKAPNYKAAGRTGKKPQALPKQKPPRHRRLHGVRFGKKPNENLLGVGARRRAEATRPACLFADGAYEARCRMILVQSMKQKAHVCPRSLQSMLRPWTSLRVWATRIGRSTWCCLSFVLQSTPAGASSQFAAPPNSLASLRVPLAPVWDELTPPGGSITLHSGPIVDSRHTIAPRAAPVSRFMLRSRKRFAALRFPIPASPKEHQRRNHVRREPSGDIIEVRTGERAGPVRVPEYASCYRRIGTRFDIRAAGKRP
jgi:hypothetical protein